MAQPMMPFEAGEAVMAVMPILIADLDTGEIVYCTRPLEQMFGYMMRNELLRMVVEDLVPLTVVGMHAQHRHRFSQNPAPRTMGEQSTLKGRHKDGHEFPVEISLSPIVINQRRCVVATVLDMSTRNSNAGAKAI